MKQYYLPLFSFAAAFFILSTPLAIAAPADAVLSIVPTYNEGDTITVEVQMDTGEAAVSGIHVHIEHSANMELIDSSVENSVIDQEVLPLERNGSTMEFARLRFDEGFTGTDGKLIELTFRLLETGETSIMVNAEKSELIAFVDSTNVLKEGRGIRATIDSLDAETALENVEETVQKALEQKPYLQPEEQIIETEEFKNAAPSDSLTFSFTKNSASIIIIVIGIAAVAMVFLFRKKPSSTLVSGKPQQNVAPPQDAESKKNI